MFPKLMGKEMAAKVLDEGLKFTAEEGVKMGFIDHISADREALERDAMAMATELAGKDRWFDAEPGLYHELLRVNQREVDVLEHAWVSDECFSALAAYLSSRRQHVPALVLRSLNMTRSLWDRDDL
jgi:enoyl-CoA hydratase/carnithine racemase